VQVQQGPARPCCHVRRGRHSRRYHPPVLCAAAAATGLRLSSSLPCGAGGHRSRVGSQRGDAKGRTAVWVHCKAGRSSLSPPGSAWACGAARAPAWLFSYSKSRGTIRDRKPVRRRKHQLKRQLHRPTTVRQLRAFGATGEYIRLPWTRRRRSRKQNSNGGARQNARAEEGPIATTQHSTGHRKASVVTVGTVFILDHRLGRRTSSLYGALVTARGALWLLEGPRFRVLQRGLAD
jgi:hypothetical protein